jgi:hypothetical protein
LEGLARDKHSSLLWAFIYYGCKRFITLGSGCQKSNLQLDVVYIFKHLETYTPMAALDCTQASKKRTLNVEDVKREKNRIAKGCDNVFHTLLSSNWNPQRAALKRQTNLIFRIKNEGIGNAVKLFMFIKIQNFSDGVKKFDL